jgi:hypothetical protein
MTGKLRRNVRCGVESPDGHYQAVFSNGVLSDRITGGRTLWSVGTSEAGSYGVLQPNGMLVIFGPGGEVDWDSGSTGTGCPALGMQLDGNLVDSDPAAIWSAQSTLHGMAGGDKLEPGWSIYAPGEEYRLEMQTDGDLVLDNDSGTKIWSSETSSAGAYAAFQTGGNLVVYSTTGTALWQSKTTGNSGATLALGSDGNIVIDSSAGMELWSSDSTGNAGTGSAFAVTVTPAASATPCPGSVTVPTTTVVQTQTQTETQTVTTTQTVSVPTTTVQTVAVPTPRRGFPHVVDVKLAIKFGLRGRDSVLQIFHMARLPRGTELTIRYKLHAHDRRATVRRARTAKAVRALVRFLFRTTYRPGQTLNLDLTHPGYLNEYATFTFRAGKAPLVRPKPTRR